MVNCKIKSHDAVTTVCCPVGNGICCRIVAFGIGDTVYPQIGITGSDCICSCCCMVNNQINGNDAVTSADIWNGIQICVTCRPGIISTGRNITFTTCNRNSTCTGKTGFKKVCRSGSVYRIASKRVFVFGRGTDY